MAKSGETVLVHGAAGRVGVAELELGTVAGLRLYGTCSARDMPAVERLGAVAIDYRNEDFLARVRELTGGAGVDVVLDSLGGPISLRSFRALRPGGRLVVFGRYSTLSNGHKDWRAVFEWYASVAAVWAWGTLSPRRRVLKYQIQKFRDHAQWRDGAVGGEPRYPEWFREDFATLIQLLRQGKIHPVVAERLPLAEARHAHELLESSASKGKLVLVP
jgi:NADPH:quinone reductase